MVPTKIVMIRQVLRIRSPVRSFSALTHLSADGRAAMVDVSAKTATIRTAKAAATVELGEEVYKALCSTMKSEAVLSTRKGDVFTVAQLAGIQAAKSTHHLIPLCHSISLSHISVDLSLQPATYSVDIESTARTAAQTGVEMEALTAASVAALTVYDMCKAAGKGIIIRSIKLLEKTGGKSDFKAGDPNP